MKGALIAQPKVDFPFMLVLPQKRTRSQNSSEYVGIGRDPPFQMAAYRFVVGQSSPSEAFMKPYRCDRLALLLTHLTVKGRHLVTLHLALRQYALS